MIVSEYTKGLKNSYVRIRELSLPDERKYQYCIMKRGGISGFLPFEIRYIDTDAYMYYDITSKQNISTLYSKKPLDRKWVVDFFGSMKRITEEAIRFLLDPSNLIWNPSNVYMDLTNGKYGFLYVPYLDEDNGLSEMIDFIVSHVDYSDDELVKCVYGIAEQYKASGDIYMQEKLYLDVAELKSADGHERSDYSRESDCDTTGFSSPEADIDNDQKNKEMDNIYENAEKIGDGFKAVGERPVRLKPENKKKERTSNKSAGLFSFIKRVKEREAFLRDEYGSEDEFYALDSVAEETVYSDTEKEEESESEGTVFVDLSEEDKKARLESETGSVLYSFEDDSCVIGKKEAEADLVFDEPEVSRMHARIFMKDGDYYLEDLNSTNGTFKNGLKLKPYEQKKLAKGDEIKIATRKIIFR